MSIRREEIQKVKKGKYIMMEGEPCVIKAVDDSMGGKHGGRVYKIICVGMFDNKKRIQFFPCGEKVEIPEIIKGKAHVNYIEEEFISIMVYETFEQYDLEWPRDEELKSKLKEIQSEPSKLIDTEIDYIQLAGRVKINKIVDLSF